MMMGLKGEKDDLKTLLNVAAVEQSDPFIWISVELIRCNPEPREFS